ncbi:MAG TPA: translocation/assembly module TamB domain-containing protein [Gemmatimonadales bacterium]|nr:translocation/assembly module TamB domain-containing protein [Gemmatimonadales bacterium]
MRWRRLVRRVLAWSVGPPLVLLATVAGTLLALMYSPPGRALLARSAGDWLTGQIAGRLEIGAMHGNLVNHLVLEDLVVRDSTGTRFASARRLELRYLLPELLAGRIILRNVRADGLDIHLVRLRRDRWNYQEIFRSGHGSGGGAPPRIELHDVQATAATIRVDAPTDPVPPPVPISRHGAVPARPEVLASPDGLVRVRRLTHLDGSFPLIRVSTPADDPLRVEFDRFAATLSEPAVTIVAARGQLEQQGDSLRFTLDRAALPGTVLSGGGTVRWPTSAMEFDFTLAADTVALRDLRWVQPDFPDWTGAGTVVAHSTGPRHTDFRLDPLVLGDGTSRARGRLTAMVDDDQGFGIRDLDLTLSAVPLAIVRPYLDTLPFDGTLSGRLRADGYRARIRTSGTLDFVDALAAGRPTSRLVFDGAVRFGGASGAVFDALRLQQTTLDLATVRHLVPAVALPGTLTLRGQLDGAWDDATFRGVTEHEAPNGALSRMIGMVRLDTRRPVLGLELDARFDPLSFDGLRSGYPALSPRGALTGTVRAAGRLDSLSLTADVSGEFGAVEADGVVSLDAPHYAADSLSLVLRRFDVDAMLGQGTSTALNGRIVVRGVLDSLVKPRGVVTLDLGQSRIGGATIDEARGLVRSDGRLISFTDTDVRWPDGEVRADGTLGWTEQDRGALTITAQARRLTAFDSLARATLGLTRDSVTPRPFDGTVRGEFTVVGSLEHPAISGHLDAENLVLDAWSVTGVTAQLSTDSLSVRGLQLTATIDSVEHNDVRARRLTVDVGGTSDSLTVSATGDLPSAMLAVGGWRRLEGPTRIIGIDSLRLGLPHQTWTLAAPVRATVTDEMIRLTDTLRVITIDGSGTIELSGSIPGRGDGELDLSAVGVDLADLYALAQRDTTEVRGVASIDARLSGSRSSPRLRGNAMVTGPIFRDVQPPLARAVFDYRDELLRSNITFWKTGSPVLEVDASLPFDLALASREERRLPGPIEIHAYADSADLAILQALTPALRDTRGAVSLDLQVGGTWEAPALAGSLEIVEGRMTLPSLGVRYGPIFGRARFVGDSMVIDSLLLSSGEGDLLVGGHVRFADLSDPRLNLTFDSRGFLAMDVPDFLVLRPTGVAHLTGPLTNPVLSGNTIQLDNSTLYFTDLISKDVIKLEDPAYANLVDLEELKQQRLGVAFQNRFLDSLRVDNMRFQLGTNVRLLSEDADIQMEGAVTVRKTGSQYLVNGDLSTPRGRYTLRLGGFLTTDFDVQRGTVRFFGTPDLNASIDLQAQHLARTEGGDELPVIARITGTIQVPKVELSVANSQLPQVEIISYLIFGRPSSQLGSGSDRLALQSAVGLLAGETGRALGQQFGLDLFQFSAELPLGTTSGASFNRLAIGKQLGEKWFVTANAGFCLGGDDAGQISARNFGASLEYRFAREWRVQASAEPVQTCVTNRLSEAFSSVARRYQLGADLLWEKEY